MTALIPEHEGHPGWYKDCTEQACLDRHARYMKRWRYERVHGQLRITSAEQARIHVSVLIGLGWSLRSIAATAGLSVTSVHRLNAGAERANRRTIAAILAVDPDQVPAAASKQTAEPFVPRTGTTRRIQALLFMGWPHHEISKAAGLKSASLLNQQGRWVTRSTHDKVATAYDLLAMTPGPSELTRGWARRFGYAGPLDWDDIDLDAAPATDRPSGIEEFDEIAVERVLSGDRVSLTKAERLEVVRRLHAQGLQDGAIGSRVGCSPDLVKKDRRLLQLPANPRPDAHPVATDHQWARGQERRRRLEEAS